MATALDSLRIQRTSIPRLDAGLCHHLGPERDLERKIEALEMRYDEQFAIIFDAIKQLIADDRERKTKPNRRIGFL